MEVMDKESIVSVLGKTARVRVCLAEEGLEGEERVTAPANEQVFLLG